MMRLVFFLCLIACALFGAHIYLSETQPHSDALPEVNRDALKIVSAADPVKAQPEAPVTRKSVESPASSACIEFNVKPADVARAQTAFTQMQLGDRLSTKNAEDAPRFGVGFPPQKSRQVADTIVANIKKTGIKDVTIAQDNSISLGIFSTEEKAKRHLSDVLVKAPVSAKGAAVSQRSGSVKEAIFTVRDPDTTMIARLTTMQREYEGSVVKAISCPVPGTATEPGKSAKP